MNKVLSIVIPVFNKYAFTRSCLKDLAQLPQDHEIIVVDNASSDETQKELQNNSRIIYLRNKENKGFASAVNSGYNVSTAPNVLFLNNDIRVKSNFTDWTSELIKYSSKALVGPTMGQLDSNFNFVQEKNGMLIGPNTYMSGWCLCSSKEIWNKLKIKNYSGPFSEEFFCYFEDSDLSLRAVKLKIDREVVSIPVVHFGRITSAQLNTGQLYKQAKQIFDIKWKSK